VDLVYLDHAAQTRCEPAAVEAVAEILSDYPAHSLAAHALARRLRSRIERARSELADYLGCSPFELQFHCSGSAALRTSIAYTTSVTQGSIVTLGTEHPTIGSTLDGQRPRVKLLPMKAGAIDVDAAGPALAHADVVVLSAMNHELGTAPDLERLFALAPQAFWVIDAIQAGAWLDLRPCFRARSFVVVSSQKMGGPAGASALRVPPDTPLPCGEVATDGEASPATVIGFGAACAARAGRRESARLAAAALGNRLLRGLVHARPGGSRNGDGTWVGPILNIAWPDLAGREIEHILDLESVALARTSACRQRFDDVSTIVKTAYPDEEWRAQGATRWSIGWTTTEAEIDEAVARFASRFGSK
jgi:cysteine desulfurase